MSKRKLYVEVEPGDLSTLVFIALAAIVLTIVFFVIAIDAKTDSEIQPKHCAMVAPTAENNMALELTGFKGEAVELCD